MSPLLSEVVGDFLSQLAVGRQPRTIETYAVSLRRFRRFLSSKENLVDDPEIGELTIDHAIEFIKSLRTYAPATIGNYMSALSGFYRYLFGKRLIHADAFDHQRLLDALEQMRPKFSRLPHVPADDLIDRLIKVAATKKENETENRKRSAGDKERDRLGELRNVALLCALRSSGMRISEALALRRGDLDYQAKSARVLGKGRKERIVYFGEIAWNVIQEYLRARQDGVQGRSLGHLPVFARHDRRSGKSILPLTRQRVEQIFAELGERAGLEQSITPHGLRHSFATRILEESGDLAAVQDMLGHRSPVTTRIYAQVSQKRLREIHRRTFDSTRDKKDQ